MINQERLSEGSPSCFSSFKKTSVGFVLSILSILLDVISNILIKKIVFFSSFENATFRFFVQLIVLIIIAKYKHLNVFGPKESRILLILRGAIGTIGMSCHYTSLKLIDPADTISLFSCHVLFTMVLTRIFLKERIRIFNIVVVILVLIGVMFIAQPSFLMPINHQNNHTINENINVTINSSSIKFSDEINKGLGLFFALISGLGYTICSILIKKAQNHKTHFSIINLYASYFGIPVTLIFSGISIGTGYTPKDISEIYKSSFVWDIFYALLSGLLGVASQVTWIISLKFDDVTKISIYRTSHILFTFLFQYIILDIAANTFKIFGAVLITLGMILVTVFNLIDNIYKNKRAIIYKTNEFKLSKQNYLLRN